MHNDPRQRWTWEQVTPSTHCGNCIANCSYHLYARDGAAVLEEQSGDWPAYKGIPDMNPLGCQKGAAWQVQRTSADRVLHPMRRRGERRSGSWERISWDEAFDLVADGVVDALEEQGPESIVFDNGTMGGLLGSMGRGRLAAALQSVVPDANAIVSDVHQGHWATFGNLLAGCSADDTFRSEVIIVWNANPAFTRIPYFHYLAEARWRGATVVLVAPDFSPSAVHADLFVPIEPGTDAALALSMCHVILEDGLADLDFLRSQTDLALLVRKSNGRFLRETDLVRGDQRIASMPGWMVPRCKWIPSASTRQPRLDPSSSRAASRLPL